MTDWAEGYFDEDYLRRYAPLLTAAHSDTEAAAVERLLGLEAGSRILDLGCGWGRHVVAMARRGHPVCGVDRSAALLRRARTDIAPAGGQAAVVLADLRALPLPDASVDAALSLFNSFGYHASEADDAQVLAEAARVLVPGGRLLLETEHLAGALRDWRDREVTRDDSGRTWVEQRWLDLRGGRISSELQTVAADGTRERRTSSVRCYSLPELAALAAPAGLALTAWYGDLDGEALTMDAPTQVAVLRSGAYL